MIPNRIAVPANLKNKKAFWKWLETTTQNKPFRFAYVRNHGGFGVFQDSIFFTSKKDVKRNGSWTKGKTWRELFVRID